jgi:hypothetical protein
MPLKVENQFELDREKRQLEMLERQKKERAIEELRINLQKAIQRDPRTLSVEYAGVIRPGLFRNAVREYRVEFDYESARGPLGILKQRKTRVVAQVFDFREDGSAKYSFFLAVFDEADAELARKIAAILTMVYPGEDIKLRVTQTLETAYSCFE